MKGLFLDPRAPLATCDSPNCQACALQGRLVCHFSPGLLARFLVVALPPFILGGTAIARGRPWHLIPCIALILAFFGLVEIRVLCSHCPHYAEPGTRSLQCWANYGSPKLWRYRPGPMSAAEKLTFFAGLALIAGFPLALLILGRQWLLLVLFASSVLAMATCMRRRMCARCINFACPLNRVGRLTRQAFLARNPVVAQAWADSHGDR